MLLQPIEPEREGAERLNAALDLVLDWLVRQGVEEEVASKEDSEATASGQLELPGMEQTKTPHPKRKRRRKNARHAL